MFDECRELRGKGKESQNDEKDFLLLLSDGLSSTVQIKKERERLQSDGKNSIRRGKKINSFHSPHLQSYQFHVSLGGKVLRGNGRINCKQIYGKGKRRIQNTKYKINEMYIQKWKAAHICNLFLSLVFILFVLSYFHFELSL